jgi:hypothetical protein
MKLLHQVIISEGFWVMETEVTIRQSGSLLKRPDILLRLSRQVRAWVNILSQLTQR